MKWIPVMLLCTAFSFAHERLPILEDGPQYDSIGYGESNMELNGELALLKSCRKQRVIFDVGANKGEWSRHAVEIAKKAEIYAFEPVPKIYKQLTDNLKDRPAVKTFNVALSDTEAARDIFFYPQESGLSTLYDRAATLEKLQLTSETVQIKTVRLDDFCKERQIGQIDFLKIDTEGSEKDVLEGASEYLDKQLIKGIQFEYGGTYPDAGITLRKVYKYLRAKGYEVYRIAPIGLIHIQQWRSELENYQYSNYFARPGLRGPQDLDLSFIKELVQPDDLVFLVDDAEKINGDIFFKTGAKVISIKSAQGASADMEEWIHQYGRPQFCKINWSGNGYSVINTLRSPIKNLCVNFDPKDFISLEASIHFLAEAGYDQFNYTLGENDEFISKDKMSADELLKSIKALDKTAPAGEIYAFYTQDIALHLYSAVDDSEDSLTQLKKAGLIQKDKPLKLHLGCGERHLPGYINIDFPPEQHTVQIKRGADFYCDITKLNFPKGAIAEVRLHHVFEHFPRQMALAFLCAWYEWLDVGGTLHIETPDFKAGAKAFSGDQLDYKQKQQLVRHLFGSHEAQWAVHWDGWYEEKYKHILTVLGFDQLEFEFTDWSGLFNIIVRAQKMNGREDTALRDRAKKILKENLVAEQDPGEIRMWEEWSKEFDQYLDHMITKN